MLHHGGNLLEASKRWGIAPEQWLDLSTGISPISYPLPQIPDNCWHNLPQEEDGLEEAAQAYLGTNHLLPLAGSQAVINLLPYLRARSRVLVLENSYLEHKRTWQLAGHEVLSTKAESIKDALNNIDVLILTNPDNPSAHLCSCAELTALHEQLKAKDGWLILDEAFIDATPEKSMAHTAGKKGLIILRSFGKFFGLAGIRGGLIMAWPELLTTLHEKLYPWHLSGPSRFVMRTALLDKNWQEKQRVVLLKLSRRLALLLGNTGHKPIGTALFQFIESPHAALIHNTLAENGILTRLYNDTVSGIRFGLPDIDESNWIKLETALKLSRTQF
jgi:cobalamin biosynthetic protein CobC